VGDIFTFNAPHRLHLYRPLDPLMSFFEDLGVLLSASSMLLSSAVRIFALAFCRRFSEMADTRAGLGVKDDSDLSLLVTDSLLSFRDTLDSLDINDRSASSTAVDELSLVTKVDDTRNCGVHEDLIEACSTI
jgi:hypothetical protein